MNRLPKKILLIFTFCLTLLLSTVSAFANGYDRRDTVDPSQYEDIGSGLLTANANAWRKINGVCYNGSGVVIPGAITRGVDVSEWDGTAANTQIDWAKVKNSDVDFAIVRALYGTNRLDWDFAYNMKAANAAGVPVGVYVYSRALTPATALQEAQAVIKLLKDGGYQVSYPLCFDMEDSTMLSLTNTERSQIALAFCNEVKKAGYYPMLYINQNWYNNYMDWSILNGLDVWLASYSDRMNAPSTSTYKYTIWQSSSGDTSVGLSPTVDLVDGINVNFDINFGYVDYTKIVVPRTGPVSSYTASASPDTSAYSRSSSTVLNGWVTSGSNKYYYVNGVLQTGWKTIGGKRYYFNKGTGQMKKNFLFTYSNGQKGYLGSNGALVKSKWLTYKNKTYYFDAKGRSVSGIVSIDGEKYAFSTKSCTMMKNYKYISPKGYIFFFGSDGIMLKNGFHTVSYAGVSQTYYFTASGTAYTGWHTIDGKKYYFYKGSNKTTRGSRAENVTLKNSSGLVSVFDSEGVCTEQYYE